MPKSRWLRNIALGGWLIACLVGMQPALAQVQKPEAESAETQANEQQNKPEPPQPLNVIVTIPPKDEKAPRPYEKLCDDPQNNEEADVCQQWRMANAAKEQIYWLGKQYGLTQWEIGLLIGSIMVTLAAAVAAIIAARAAQKSVSVASDTAERQLRAYVALVGGTAEWIENTRLRITIEIKNTGQTPAYGLKSNSDVRIGASGPATLASTSFDNIQSVFDLGANVPMKFPFTSPVLKPETFSGARDGTIPVCVKGEIEYRDVFGQVIRHTRYHLAAPKWGGTLIVCADGNESD